MTAPRTGIATAQPPFGCFQILSMVDAEAVASQTALASSAVRFHCACAHFRRPVGASRATNFARASRVARVRGKMGRFSPS